MTEDNELKLSVWPGPTWADNHPFIMLSLVLKPSTSYIDGKKVVKPIEYRAAYNQEKLLYMIKVYLATHKQGADSLPVSLARKVGYGDRLIIVDGLPGAGKSSLCYSVKKTHKLLVDPYGATPPIYIFDNPITNAALQPGRYSRRTRVRLTLVQCKVLRAWERCSAEVIAALRQGGKVLVVRGPQGYAAFDNSFIPNYARKVFVARIEKLLASWMEAQGLVGYSNPPRVCVDIPGTLEDQLASLKAGLGDVYTEYELYKIHQQFDLLNSGGSPLSNLLHMSEGLCLKWHTAFAELLEWAQQPNTPVKKGSAPIWVHTDLCLVDWHKEWEDMNREAGDN